MSKVMKSRTILTTSMYYVYSVPQIQMQLSYNCWLSYLN